MDISMAVIHESEHGDVSAAVGEAMRVIPRCHESLDSVRLLENLQHVSESFGYRIRVRRSEYEDMWHPSNACGMLRWSALL